MKKIFKIKLLVLMAVTFCSCTEEHLIESAPASGIVNMTTYDYLNSNPAFDQLVKVINKTDKQSLVNKDDITFFALQNESILAYLGSRDFGSVEEADTDELILLLEKYIFDGKRLRDQFETGLGEDFVTVGSSTMNVKIVIGKYKGVKNVGARNIVYTDTELYANLKEAKQNTSPAETLVTTGDIQTTNGAIHVIESSHKFGF